MTTGRLLSEDITVAGRFARSANLERDLDLLEPLEGYVVTARALDVVERVASVGAKGAAGGAWSITGPYGSGKSSLALLLDATFGEHGPRRELAFRLLGDASVSVCELVQEAHGRYETADLGFHRGLVTASREPVALSVLRALHSAVVRRYGRIPGPKQFAASSTLRNALAAAASTDPRRTGPPTSAIIEIARCLAADAPLLLIIDEFGKSLQAVRDGADADPYLLQQLAEAGQGSGLPIFTITLQHLSFEDYFEGVNDSYRMEWAKVQGRFEDIAYVESTSQTRALIATVFDVASQALSDRIDAWADVEAKKMVEVGLPELGNPSEVAACYPLHPLTTTVLAELCSRYGQHERTLFSFLAGPDLTTVRSFLSRSEVSPDQPLPSVGLDALYEYFVETGALTGQSGRWTEIATRIRDTHGLSPAESNAAKSIAVLNLVSSNGALRASRRVLATFDVDGATTLESLEAMGVATYRSFADEYRIWQGTDLDIRRMLDAAHDRVRRLPLVEVLESIDKPAPVVAARHSSEHDVLRIFERRYTDGRESVEAPHPFSPFDGEVLLVVGESGAVPELASESAGKPVVAAVPDALDTLDSATREVAAIAAVLDEPDVKDDWVARVELGERLAQARVAFEKAVTTTFSTDACRWLHLRPGGAEELVSGRGSVPLSAAADAAYQATPIIRNEMLNRTEVTSQGAKARRLLMEAMIEHHGEQELGLGGYGPEVAMYRALLASTGIHSYDNRNESWTFSGPTSEAPSIRQAWKALESEFRRARSHRVKLTDTYAVLLSPPFGMKAAVVPVFVTAGLLARNDEVALYEHGTFKPVLTPELAERMVKNPSHFDIKHFANTSGARRQVVDELASFLDVKPRFRKHRVGNVLAIVSHLIMEMSRLDNYTKQASDLSEPTVRVRDVLLSAVEPDELLFREIPVALGLRPVPVGTKTYSRANEYAEALGGALREMAESYQKLLRETAEDIVNLAPIKTRIAIIEQASVLESDVMDSAIRALVLTLGNDVESDEAWAESVATVVSKKAPAEWTDPDRAGFRRSIIHQMEAFNRLAALHIDRHAHGDGAFAASRWIVTRPDGQELITLASVAQNQEEELSEVFDEMFHKFTEMTGSSDRAWEAIMGIAGKRLLPETEVTPRVATPVQINPRRVGNG